MCQVKKQLKISAWNIRGLGEKVRDKQFIENIDSDINILLETWKGETQQFTVNDYLTINKCRKRNARAKRFSGGIIIAYKKHIHKGLHYIEKGTNSPNRLWLKLDKNYFGFKNNVYVGCIYLPPISSNHYDDDMLNLENEINHFNNKGEVLLLGDFNARTACDIDFIEKDSIDLNQFTNDNILPENYPIDFTYKRNSLDQVINMQGKNLLNLCISARLRMLNGRYIGDLMGNYTCISNNGYSTVDYCIASESLLSSVLYFKTGIFSYLSDHAKIEVHLKCNIDVKNNNLISKEWKNCEKYIWKEESKTLLLKYLATEKMKDEILYIENKKFSQNQEGVDEATKIITDLMVNITENCCKHITIKMKKHKQRKVPKWSDNSVHELKTQINWVASQIRKNPFDLNFRIRFFSLCKELKKLVKQKKNQYKKLIFSKLEETFNQNIQEYWDVLKNMKTDKELVDRDDNEEIFHDIDKLKKHFQEQGVCKQFDKGFEDSIVKELKSLENELNYVDLTDKPITCSEIKQVISKLKLGKSTGPDTIPNEVLKHSSVVTLPTYAKLFNLLISTGCYPKLWEKSYVIALHKGGDKNMLSNYRGISLMNCFSKIFSAVLNSRLVNLISTKYNAGQFGFRENHRTSDSIFVIKSLINKYLHKNKKKIYVCFVDLKKAFDSLWRNGLLYKLIKVGIGKNMYEIIKSQFVNTEGAIKYKDKHSDFFKIQRGVRQGDSISPTLFNIFINDLDTIFNNDFCSPLKLLEHNVSSLLFADDLVILSESKIGLQNCLNNLEEYCNKWQLTVNVDKTKSMIFQNKTNYKNEEDFLMFKNDKIENVTEFKFLGNKIKYNGNLEPSSEDLAKKARKAMYSIKSYTSSYSDLPVKVSCNLFDTLIRPILCYNSEIFYMDIYLKYYRAKQRSIKNNFQVDKFDFIDKTTLEKVHLHFCKNILGVRRNSTNLTARAELGRSPVEKYIAFQTIKYLSRLHMDDINPLLKDAFQLCKVLDSENNYSWFTYAKDICSDIGIDINDLGKCKNVKILNNFQKIFKKQIDNYYNNILSNKILQLNEDNKIFLYKYFKQETSEFEYYLSHPNFETRKNLTKFRTSDHSLQIEVGRYKKIPREQRFCLSCDQKLDDEYHFFLHCQLNSKLRKELENNLDLNSETATDKIKLITILNPSTPSGIKAVTSFIQRSLELRREG